MAAPLVLRPLNDTEAHDLHALAHGRKVEARLAGPGPHLLARPPGPAGAGDQSRARHRSADRPPLDPPVHDRRAGRLDRCATAGPTADLERIS